MKAAAGKIIDVKTDIPDRILVLIALCLMLYIADVIGWVCADYM